MIVEKGIVKEYSTLKEGFLWDFSCTTFIQNIIMFVLRQACLPVYLSVLLIYIMIYYISKNFDRST